MKNANMVFAVAILAVFVIASLALFGAASYSKVDKEGSPFTSTFEYQSAVNSEIPILILSTNVNEDEIKAYLRFGTSNILIGTSVEGIEPNVTVIVDKSWINSRSTTSVNDTVASLIENGNIVLSIGNSGLFTNNPAISSHAFGSGEIYGMNYDEKNGKAISYSVCTGDMSLSFMKTYCWIYKNAPICCNCSNCLQ